MVERILEPEAAIRQVLSSDHKTSHLLLCWQDIGVLESANKALALLKEFAYIMFGERYITVSAIKPILKHLEKDVLGENELLNVASFLDPQFKLDSVAEEDKSKVESRVKEEAEGAQVEESEEKHKDPQAPEQLPFKKRKLGDILKKKQSISTTTTTEDRVSSEMEQYLLVHLQDSTSDPLDRWRVHVQVYLHLSKLAKCYLCICATSTPSERLFSTAGNVMTKKRSSLKLSKVDMLVFLAEIL